MVKRIIKLNRKELALVKSIRKSSAKQEYEEREQRRKESEYKRYNRFKSREERYAKTRTGKFGRGISRTFSLLGRRGGVSRALYMRGGQIEPPKPTRDNNVSQRNTTIRRVGNVGRGRPKGSFDVRYVKYGGVFGYRKAMAQQRWKERQEYMERSVTNPRQRAYLDAIRARDEARMRSPEARTIPNTEGKVPMRNIMEEIDFSANLVS